MLKKKEKVKKKTFNRGKERFKVDKWDLTTLPINNNKYEKLDLNMGFPVKTNDTTDSPYYRKVKDSELVRAKIVNLYLEPDIAAKLMQWAIIYRYIYNLSIGYMYKNGFTKNNMNINVFRTIIKPTITQEMLKLIDMYDYPSHVIDSPFRDLLKNFKTASANHKAGNIKHFKLRRIKDKCKRYTLNLDSQYFGKKGNRITGLGEVRSSEPIKVIRALNKECKIQIQVVDQHMPERNKFIIIVPKTTDRKVKLIPRTEPRVVALDPGQRTFQTAFSKEGNTHIGYNNSDKTHINKHGQKVIYRCKLNKQIKRLERLHKLAFNNGVGTIVHGEMKPISVYKKAYRKYLAKLQNWIKDMHRKTALWLCKNFDVILVGNLSIKEVTSKEGNLWAGIKKSILALSHYKFRLILTSKAEEWGVDVRYVSEAYTSKTCGKCGELNANLKASKQFNCPSCNFKCDRDINGARNIYIKNM